MSGEIIDGTTGELVRIEAAPVTLFRTDQPQEVIARAAETAQSLARVVKQQKLTTSIQGRDHVRVEGWTLLGTMLGVFPICTWTRKVDDGWEARVEARTLNGQVVGAAEAQCLRSERTWASRDDYALRSMAQTRATSKALRQPLGFVMTLAGFDATPAEEMPHDDRAPAAAAPPKRQRAAAPAAAKAGLASDAQRRLIFAKAKEGNLDEEQLRALVVTVTGQESTAAIPAAKVNELLEAIELEAVPL